MKEELFREALNLKTQIDYLRKKNEILNEAKKELLSSEKRPDDIIKFVTKLMELGFSDAVFEDIVYGLIKHNEMEIEDKQTQFDSL